MLLGVVIFLAFGPRPSDDIHSFKENTNSSILYSMELSFKGGSFCIIGIKKTQSTVTNATRIILVPLSYTSNKMTVLKAVLTIITSGELNTKIRFF